MNKKIDKERSDYIFKRLTSLHQSIMRKMSFFALVIVNIYFTKFWILYHEMFANIMSTVEAVLSGYIDFFDTLKIPKFISYTLYGAEYGLAMIILIISLYLVLYELPDIHKLEEELQITDAYYEIRIKKIENDSYIHKFLSYFPNK